MSSLTPSPAPFSYSIIYDLYYEVKNRTQCNKRNGRINKQCNWDIIEPLCVCHQKNG